jgi:hypothetical protein
VLRQVAEDTHNLVTDETSSKDERTLRESAELIRVLARIVFGKTIHQAFGAPGDWGYQTEIGQALYALYSENRS